MATKRARNRKRDIQRAYPIKQFIQKLRRFAGTLESGSEFRIQVAGEGVRDPANVVINIEHELGDNTEEIEFQLTWNFYSLDGGETHAPVRMLVLEKEK